MPTRSWRDIRESKSKLTAEQRARTDARVKADIERMGLAELRKARHMTQQTIGSVLEMGQGDVSKLEHRADAYVSTLRNYVTALGGSLEIVARFPDREPVEITGFSDIEAAGSIVRAKASPAKRHGGAQAVRRKYVTSQGSGLVTGRD